jgi:hypothetical protein
LIGLTIGLDIGAKGLQILTAETGADQQAIAARQTANERAGKFH